MRAVLIATLVLSLALYVLASSHSEAPATSALPQTDVTDVYAFRSYEPGRENFVTLLANWNPRQTGYGGPNYFTLDDQFFYEIYVDQTGDGIPEITYQFIFHNELPSNGTGIAVPVGDRTVPIALKTAGQVTPGNNGALNWLEFYRLNVITGSSSGLATQAGNGLNFFVKPFDYTGPKTFPNYTAYVNQYIYNANFPGCSTAGKVFVGQRQESFKINLGRIFDLVDFVPIDGASGFPGGINQSEANNVLAYTNIVTIALEVPTSCIAASGQPVIGVWAAARSIRGNRQKSRLGNPLVNELLIGLRDKDKWNRRQPFQDGLLNNYIRYPTFPAILNLLFLQAVNTITNQNLTNLAPSNLPRNDLVAVFLTGVPGLNYLQQTSQTYVEMLRLSTAVAPAARGLQSSLGVIGNDTAGYPNGRRPGDDVIDITLRAAMGVLCHANLGVCSPSNAPVGTQPFTDGSPSASTDFGGAFPYLNIPTSGSDDIYNVLNANA